MDLKKLVKHFNIFLDKATREKNTKNIEKTTISLYNKLVELPEYKNLSKEEQKNVLGNVFNDEAQKVLEKSNLCKLEKSAKDIIFDSFGMHENWKLGRNALGCFLVNLPEYPTYFIPAFTQSKTTGDAKDLKKGEGPRGMITGLLDGIAVGALVSGEKIKFGKEMIPFAILGMTIQMVSGTVFPWLGEKAGQCIYRKNLQKQTPLASQNPVNFVSKESDLKSPQSSDNKNHKSLYPNQKSFTIGGNLKI